MYCVRMASIHVLRVLVTVSFSCGIVAGWENINAGKQTVYIINNSILLYDTCTPGNERVCYA